MSFRIHRHPPLENEFRRVMHAQLVHAISGLNESTPATQARAIHDARTRIKKVRAILRLLHGVSPLGIPDACHTPLRHAARELAVVRDAHTDLKTIAELCRDFSITPARIPGVMKFLRQRESNAAADAGEAMHKSAGLLNSARFVIEAWAKGIRITREELHEGARRIYKRSRASFQKAADQQSVKSLHRCRRRTKDVAYILLLLGAAPSGPKSKLARRARKLCALLGRIHDLAHLGETLDQNTAGIQTDMLDELIDSKLGKLRGKAMKLGSKFFAIKPKKFATACAA